YKKINVPPPTFCPQCRMLRRWIWRNEHNLFRRKDAISGKNIFSNFPSQVEAKITDQTYWNSDEWDPLEYGKNYDFSRPFFEQFRELLNEVPWPSKSVLRMVNSDYSDQASDLKNCYLCFSGDVAEDSAYCVNFANLKDCFDLREAGKCELSYDSMIIGASYRSFFTTNSENCRDVWFSKDCTGCSNCFGCVGLRNKNYHIWNEPYSKEDYFKKLEEFNLGSYKRLDELRKKAHEFWKEFPVKYMHAVRNASCTGEAIWDSKNVRDSYSILDSENMRYCQLVYRKCADSYDYSVWGNSVSEMYESVTCGEQCSRIKFSWECWPGCQDLDYSMFCRSSSDLFGCVGIKKKQFCILNKEYSEEEYRSLREKIIKQMNEVPYISDKGQGTSDKKIIYKYGEFFPPEFSPFAYNETICQDYFPLTGDGAAKKGYLWREPELREFETTVEAKDLPDNIKDVKDEVLKEIIKCSSCGRAYRIIAAELSFLRRMGLPLPHLCPNCRYKERFEHINRPVFWNRKCACSGEKSDDGVYKNNVSHFHGSGHCPNKFETAYDPKKQNIVYCEQCYQTEMI
ncbi:MAG: hypothetical protein AAB884_01105, partial [Patescibacteria group bacterium]